MNVDAITVCPECGWVGTVDDCQVCGADEGNVLCPKCCEEFRPVNLSRRRIIDGPWEPTLKALMQEAKEAQRGDDPNGDFFETMGNLDDTPTSDEPGGQGVLF